MAQPSTLTYTFPLRKSNSVDVSMWNARAYTNIKNSKVTFFESKGTAYLAYAGSVMFSFVIIAVDIMLLVAGSRHDGAANNTRAEKVMLNDDKTNVWLMGVVWIMTSADVLVLLTQAIDLLRYHFTFWPLTSLTWFGQLSGLGLSSALLGTYLHYPHTDSEERDVRLMLALSSVLAHALFTSSQFSVTIEYLVRSVTINK